MREKDEDPGGWAKQAPKAQAFLETGSLPEAKQPGEGWAEHCGQEGASAGERRGTLRGFPGSIQAAAAKKQSWLLLPTPSEFLHPSVQETWMKTGRG